MSVSLDEQETVINIMRDTDECCIYTSDSTMITKLDKLVEKSDKWTLERVERDAETHEIVGKEYKTDKKLIRFAADTRHYSDEQKAAMAARLKNISNNCHTTGKNSEGKHLDDNSLAEDVKPEYGHSGGREREVIK